MPEKLKVSFNSPQCGWMSIGFADGGQEFHTTTAHTPHETALPELMNVLSVLLDDASQTNFVIRWNRTPEEFDFLLNRNGERVRLEIWQYPTENRTTGERVFAHEGAIFDVCAAFYETFAQMYEDREIDEFEQNWRQPFPFEAFERFTEAFQKIKQTTA